MAELIKFNGIDGDTGRYGIPGMEESELAAFLAGNRTREDLDRLKPAMFDELKSERATWGMEVDSSDLAEAGWGAIFAFDESEEIRTALKPLLDYREAQAGDLFKVFEDAKGYTFDIQKSDYETRLDWLTRQGVSPGPLIPEKVPCHLLIVGSPAKIPFDFQYELSAHYCVGRIDFDTVEEYARYAECVAKSETGAASPRSMAFFGPENPNDSPTELSANQLVAPLEAHSRTTFSGWTSELVSPADSTKAKLGSLIRDAGRPTFLFTASHGIEFLHGSAKQRDHQGGLICQDWPGPDTGPVDEDHYFTGADVAGAGDLSGMIAFHFACFGGGTPRFDEFQQQAFRKPVVRADPPFVARLPQALLGNENGGALAVISHVERAWDYSFLWPDLGDDRRVFEMALDEILRGKPVGFAMNAFSRKYADLSIAFNETLKGVLYGNTKAEARLPREWTSTTDARNYVIVGDPAARLNV